MTLESDYSQVCLDALINCEQLLTKTSNSKLLSPKIEKLLNECAHICMGTFYAIKYSSVNAPQMAVLCIGICEECAEACENFKDCWFERCAEACRNCSNNMYELAIQSFD